MTSDYVHFLEKECLAAQNQWDVKKVTNTMEKNNLFDS